MIHINTKPSTQPLPVPPGTLFNPYPFTTATVLIANNERLSERDWDAYVYDVGGNIEASAAAIHFAAPGQSPHPWQTRAWVFEIRKSDVADLIASLRKIRAKFEQETITWISGRMEFV